jgi:hypothetical protein
MHFSMSSGNLRITLTPISQNLFEPDCADSSQFLNFSMRPPAFLSHHARKKWLLVQGQFDIICSILLGIQYFTIFFITRLTF